MKSRFCQRYADEAAFFFEKLSVEEIRQASKMVLWEINGKALSGKSISLIRSVKGTHNDSNCQILQSREPMRL